MFTVPPLGRELADRIPTEFERLDDRFAPVNGDEWIERPFRAGRWLEGPVYYPAGRYLLFNDIPNDRTLRYDAITGETCLFAHPSGHANGSTLDRSGRRISCEQSTRRVVGTSTTVPRPSSPTRTAVAA
jgi:gluconolactonase